MRRWAGLNRPPILFYRKSVTYVTGKHPQYIGVPERIRTPDRLVRSPFTQVIFVY